MDNIYVYVDKDRAALMNTITGKKYIVSKELGLKIKENNLTEQEKEKISKICYVPKNKQEDNIFYHLRLLVTNKCNFACKYCFAERGTYHLPLSNMTFHNVKPIIDKYFLKYDKIAQISFFGGEPLINLDLIESVCEYIQEKYPRKIPSYSLVSNAYYLNDVSVKILKKYAIHCVFSIDGDASINDLQRIDRYGNGTYEKVHNNLKKYRNEIDMSIEATYTSNHVSAGISRDDLRKYLMKEYDVDRVVICDAVITKKEEQYLSVNSNDLITEVKEFFNLGEYIMSDILVNWIHIYLHGNDSPYFCGAGITKNTVDMQGKEYPCHMFVSENRKINIETINKENRKCDPCVYRPYCLGCLYSILNGYDICNVVKEAGEIFIYNMLNLQINRLDDYKRLMGNYKAYVQNNRI